MAIFGMLATTIIAKRLVPALSIAPVLVMLGVLAALNVGWRVAVARRGRPSLVTVQVLVDVFALTSLLWFAGGTSNPFAAFLSFHIVLAGLLCGGRVSVLVAALTLVAIAILS